jgi:hypothetical protein
MGSAGAEFDSAKPVIELIWLIRAGLILYSGGRCSRRKEYEPAFSF